MENSKSLISLMYKKEKIHWSRTLSIYNEIDDIGGKVISYPILVLLVSFFHYCFAFMHMLFEVYMFIFNRKRFYVNMKESHKKADKKMLQMKPKLVTVNS